MNGPGCIFDHFGKVPETAYKVETYNSPLEEAVQNNDVEALKKLIQEGCTVNIRLKLGQMSCLEYAAMMGYYEVLRVLLENSPNANTLREYFSLSDVVDRAYMISHNKQVFFDGEAMAEANRYEAALYTAVEYNQSECVSLLLTYLGTLEPNKHNFYINDNQRENLSPRELAKIRGHSECYQLLVDRTSPRQ